MPVSISGTYGGGLRTTLSHGPSGAELTTAAPRDNQGDGSSFSPTDLLTAALASCAVTTGMISFENANEEVPKTSDKVPMSKTPPSSAW